MSLCDNFSWLFFTCLTPFFQGELGLISCIKLLKKFLSIAMADMEIEKRHHNKSIFYNWHIELNDWLICIVNIRDNFWREIPLTDIFDLSCILFYTVITTFFWRGWYFQTQIVLTVLLHWYSSPSLDWVIKFSLNLDTFLHLEIEKQCLPQNNLFGQYDHYWVSWLPILHQSYYII